MELRLRLTKIPIWRSLAGFLVHRIRGTTSRHWHGHILENNHRHVTNSDVGLSGVGPTAQLHFRAQSS